MESPIFAKDNFRYERILSWYAWQGIFHHVVYQVFGTFGVLFWALIPIHSILNENVKRLPLDAWYPYDITGSLAFILTWIHQGVAITLCCINNLAIDAFITGLINVASSQFELLKRNISSIGHNLKIENSSEKIIQNSSNENIRKEIYGCIKHNLAIFDWDLRGCNRESPDYFPITILKNISLYVGTHSFVKEFQNIFSTVIGLQLTVNCLVICLSTYYVSQMKTIVSAEIVGNIGYTLCMVYQIFIYCWNGNELHLQNENLGTAIYLGNWWKLNSRHKRALHIIMIRTRRPLILSAIFLIKLTIPTFTAIIRMSYSCFTLLHRKKNA